jgi:hypothetical protein
MYCSNVDVEHRTCTPQDGVKSRSCSLKIALKWEEHCIHLEACGACIDRGCTRSLRLEAVADARLGEQIAWASRLQLEFVA